MAAPKAESLSGKMRWPLWPSHPQPDILRCACCLKGLWNVEQILRALSARARSPLASLKSRGPAQELTEFHMEARNRGISCLSLTACPTHTLKCRCPASQPLSCLSGCVCLTLCACWYVLSSFLFFSFAVVERFYCAVKVIQSLNGQITQIVRKASLAL